MEEVEAMSPIRMVSAEDISGPVLRHVIGLTGHQLGDFTASQIESIKGEKGNLFENYLPTPLDSEKLTTDNDAGMRAGAEGPDHDFGDLPPKPQDITVFCDQCCTYINLKCLTDHRFFHRSLKILRYKGAERPESVTKLLKRRQAILKKMKKQQPDGKPLDSNEIQKLNDAFEFLKADLEDTYEAFRQIQIDHDTSVRGVALNCSAGCAPAVGICSDQNNRWKSYMEDTRVFQDYFGNDMHKCYFGIYDGHHGRFAAEIAANEFHHALLTEMAKFDPRTKCTCTYNMADSYDISQYEIHSRAPSRSSERGQMHEESANVIQQIIRTCEEKFAELDNIMNEKNETRPAKKEKKKKERDPFAEKMSEAYVKAHKYVDYLLSWGKDEMSRVRWSGCSTLSCVIQSKERSLIEDRTAKEADEDLATSGKGTDSELEPPKDLGVIHLANAGNAHAVLVRGNRAYKLTRDHTPKNPKERSRVLKDGVSINDSDRDCRLNGVMATTRGLGNHGDVSLKKVVSTTPYTTSVKIDQYAQFLILASNGIWEVFSEQEAASLLLQMFPYNQIPAPSCIDSSVGQILIDAQSRLGTNSEADSEVASEAGRMVFGRALKAARADPVQPAGSPLTTLRQNANNRASAKSVTSAKSRVSVKFADEEGLKEGDLDRPEGAGDGADHVDPMYGEETVIDESGGRFKPDARPKRGNRKWSKKRSDELLDLAADLQTEVGSNIDIYSDDDIDADDSGNEADIDTLSDGFTLPPMSSRMTNQMPTKEEMQREFARKLSERLVQSAMLAGAKDNITAMVVLLPGCGLSN